MEEMKKLGRNGGKGEENNRINKNVEESRMVGRGELRGASGSVGRGRRGGGTGRGGTKVNISGK